MNRTADRPGFPRTVRGLPNRAENVLKTAEKHAKMLFIQFQGGKSMDENRSKKKPYALDTDSLETEPAEADAPEAELPEEISELPEEASELPEEASEGPEQPKAPAKKARPSSGKKKRGAAPPAKKRRKKKKKNGGGWIFLLVLALLLAGGAFYFFHTYLLVGRQIVRKDASEVDLRQTSLTPEAYEELRGKLPDAEILWNVPLSGGEYSCDSESIALSSFAEDDLSRLAYFKHIDYVDAESADLTLEQYHALSEALPDAEIDWSVPVGGGSFPNDSEKISVKSFSEQDIALLDYFPDLAAVDARACRDYPAVMALREARPDLEVTWQVPLSGKEYMDDAEELLVDDPAVTVAALEEALTYLPKVKSVDAPANTWTNEEKDALCAAWPEITFHWPVTICGTVYNGDETAMELKGRKLSGADVDEIVKLGHYLPDIGRVDLTDTGLSLADALRIKEVFPKAEFTYAFDLYGKHVTTEDTFIDFTGVKMGSMEQLESALPLLSKLEKVDMTDCGFSDEDMDKLTKRHENVRFIWTMYFGRSSVIRTDDLGFIGAMDHYLVFNNKTIKKLGYCKDMVCLDLGHRVPTGLKLDFLYDMPQLQFLILADCRAADIKPIGSLKNLIYLEMVMSYAADLSPIKECTSLLDLDVCFSYETYNQKDKNYEIFVSLADHLERLWFSSLMIEPNRVEELKKAMPKTDVHCIYATAQATGEGWRYHKRYYEMRDYLKMIYMSDYGGRQYSKWIDGVEIPLTQEFMATQREPDWSKIRR